MKVNDWSLDVRLPEKFLEGLTQSKPRSRGFPEPVDGLNDLLGQLAGSLVISKKIHFGDKKESVPSCGKHSGTAGRPPCGSGLARFPVCFPDFIALSPLSPF